MNKDKVLQTLCVLSVDTEQIWCLGHEGQDAQPPNHVDVENYLNKIVNLHYKLQ